MTHLEQAVFGIAGAAWFFCAAQPTVNTLWEAICGTAAIVFLARAFGAF
jgi:hypothetical protein